MSTKAYRKLLKEKEAKDEEKAEPKAAPKVAVAVNVQSTNRFAGFAMDESEEEEEEHSHEQKKTEEMEDKPASKEPKEEGEAGEEKKAKKKKKNKKNKKKKGNEAEDDNKKEEDDEIEPGPYPVEEEVEQASNCLELNAKMFNYNKELDRYFKGSSFVEDADISKLLSHNSFYVKERQRTHEDDA
jgi:hypothetical protein